MAGENRAVRYEPDENPPRPLAIGLACQYAILSVAGIVLTPAIIIRSAGGEEYHSYLLWAVFAALIVSGITTMIQSIGYKRVGAGHVLLMGTSATFIAISITALAKGGPSLLATLVIISALFQFFFSWKLALFRRVFTSAVGGTIIMLVAVSIMPYLFRMLTEVPATASPSAAPVSALVTLLCVVVIVFKSSGVLRLWAPVIGMAVGSVVAAFYGLFEVDRIASAPWVSLPLANWPGLDLDFSPSFWVLLPSFIFVTIIGAIETVGDAVAVQQVSWRKPRSIDFRVLQGAVSADGTGNLLSGLLSTIPNTTYSGGISLVELTGVAARRVGIWIGAVLILLAFFPKLTAVVLSIPSPVVAAYMGVLIALLFVVGMRLVIRNANYQQCLIAAIGFWMGYGFQADKIFPDLLASSSTWKTLFSDGMTSGGLVALALSLLMELVSSRRKTIKTRLSVKDLPKVHAFLSEFASSKKWGKDAVFRLCSAGEETVLSLLDRKQIYKKGKQAAWDDVLGVHPEGQTKEEVDHDDDDDEEGGRYLLMHARGNNRTIELECIASPGEENLEDKMILLKEQTENKDADDLSLRILHRIASSFHHQQYYDTDIITVKVDHRH